MSGFSPCLSLLTCIQADQLTALYVPFCRDKSAADDLLTSHRSYFDVSLLTIYLHNYICSECIDDVIIT